MNRQIFYNGPLSQICTVPFPQTFPPCNSISLFLSGPLNHPLPPKPPTSKYFFHAYSLHDRDLVTPRDSTTSQHNERGECVPVNDEPEFPSDYQIGVLDSPMAENIISLPSEDTLQGLGSDCEVMSSFSVDIADLPRPGTFLLAQNHDSCGCKSLVSPKCADDGIYCADVDPASEAPETPPCTSESSGGNSISDNDGDGLMRHLTEHATLSSMCIKRPAVAALDMDENANVRAEASEASSSLPTPCSSWRYSAAEDEREFGLLFAKRTLRSLQMRWLRTQKLTAPWTRCLKRKKSSRP
ncbi:uncharacterized protein P174DRAFT_516124 [Aspergillus novofumigatus IBT 16806]|uniref:Uncharacterized protein n=1 Tax=Aspergillus novofumigatus (strain IBT 16806) TaxID=1392255 RepID=A0A2I1BTX9_ASPN1|nr:uncharacterized protein P174DRAFT_516124 [Aspergillus novofumigatus IBT 16806]PKX88855.1 hypothetical protein P174DRAFT_516124 [Aspergillus novofumigatus IBT 16806]